VVQLLLTASMANREGALEHAVAAMALAGAMAAQLERPISEIRSSMLAGLIHDLGEIYINPDYQIDAQPHDLNGYKQMAAHPRVAQMLLAATTDTPEAVSRAVAEHHERLDGSGYPARLASQEVSALGRMLGIVESSMAVLRSNSPTTLADISFALRVVPGEFDLRWAGLQFDAAQRARENLGNAQASKAAELGDELSRIRAKLDAAKAVAQSLRSGALNLKALDIADHFVERLGRLIQAFNAIGLWSMPAQDLSGSDLHEMQRAAQELSLRVNLLQRECLLRSEGLQGAE
jgi:hypothetical protein